MEGSKIWISFRQIWFPIPLDFDFVPTGFDFVPTDFEFIPHVMEVGKGRGVDALRLAALQNDNSYWKYFNLLYW
jgi:hypothetical protein